MKSYSDKNTIKTIYDILPDGKCGCCKIETIRRVDKNDNEFWFYPSDDGLREHKEEKTHLLKCPRCKQLVKIDSN